VGDGGEVASGTAADDDEVVSHCLSLYLPRSHGEHGDFLIFLWV